MSECPRCPNCGLVNPENLLEDLWWCGECGTAFDWSKNNPGYDPEAISVPRRSQPATVLELPDVDGWWWMWFECGKEWVAKDVRMSPSGPKCGFGAGVECLPGRYVRCEPPIVKPEPEPVDEDAELLRRLATLWRGNYMTGDGSLPSEDDLCRIADRLESMEKEPT